MSDLDLAALTEAANEALRERGWPSEHELDPDQVRAVLEALPREWGVQCRSLDGDWSSVRTWTTDRGEADLKAGVLARGHGQNARVVRRAVGPPIPADEPQDTP